MMAGGIALPVLAMGGGGAEGDANVVVRALFEEFKLSHAKSSEEKSGYVESKKETTDWISYSRTPTFGAGERLTVEVLKYKNGRWLLPDYVVRVFDSKGEEKAKTADVNFVNGKLLVSSGDEKMGKDVILSGALSAVTGRPWRHMIDIDYDPDPLINAWKALW